MKKLIIVLFSLGLVTAASAQYHRDYDRDRHERSGVVVRVGTPGYHDRGWDRHHRWEERRYAERMWQIRHNPRLSPWQKRRMIHEMQEHREMAYGDGWHSRY